MSWHTCDLMKAREEFILDWKRGGLPFAGLCRRHGISRKTGYKWLGRHAAEGLAGLADHSRKPRSSPARASAELEARVIAIRGEYPCWGGRKIRQVILREGGVGGIIPASSTVTNILRRHDLLGPGMRGGAKPFIRFRRAEPNDLWQMDFKGHFAMAGGRRCHPLTVLDDHSRYNLVLQACGAERDEEVRRHLVAAFQRFGLPRQLLCDHGSPWGTGLRADGGIYGRTALSYWLMRLGVEMIHGRPRHPQTQGKEERFHRTLDMEVIARTQLWRDLEHCQQAFERFTRSYNEVRGHEELEMATPGECYRPSAREYPGRLPEVEGYYLEGDVLRQVRSKGEITFGNRTYAIGSALAGQMVALRGGAAGTWDVYYCWKKLGVIHPAEATKEKGSQNRLLED